MADEEKKAKKAEAAEAPKEPSTARRMLDGRVVADQKEFEAARKGK